jgi:TM2 domain-containing membrane protein YozV
MKKSSKNYIATVLLCFFLGFLGIHRFYVGKVWTGILMFLTCGGFGIWIIIDMVTIVCGQFADKQGFLIKPEV